MRVGEYFTGPEASGRIFEAVREAVAATGPADIRVTKSQISFRRRGGGSFVWVPNMYLRKRSAPLVLTIGLPRRVESSRWAQVAEPVRGSVAHHLELRSAADIDDEVRAWLREAWEAAA